MIECRGEGDNERYFLQRITFKYCEDPFTRKETTNIDEYVRQIMTFINIYVMDFAQEQKIPIIVAHQRNGRAGFPEYVSEIRFDFANAQPGQELKKDTVLDFYNKTLNKFSDFLKIFKHLNNNHKTKTVAYWPPEKPEKSDFKCKMLGEKDENGNVTVVHCTYDPESRGGETADGRKVKGTSHWVSAKHAVNAEVRLYDKLFATENPGGATGNYLDDLNPNSLIVMKEAKIEPSVADAKPGEYLQFIRSGYFTPDYDTTAEHPIFNRTVTLKDSWAKQKAKIGM